MNEYNIEERKEEEKGSFDEWFERKYPTLFIECILWITVIPTIILIRGIDSIMKILKQKFYKPR